MNESDIRTFDLCGEPWIPARTLTGEAVELSLMDLFDRAHELVALSGDLATQDAALTRLLLAVLHRAVGGPRDFQHWRELWNAERLPGEQISDYLSTHRDRFDLFHPRTPFFQVPDLRTARGETSELNKLVADVPNGRPFFTNRLGGEMSLSFAEAARWLVHCQAFDPSGIKSGAQDDPRTKGGKGYPIGTGWCGRIGTVLVEGATVRETLLLNLLPADFDETGRAPGTDLPSWEREPGPVGQERTATGPLDLYTWQARRIRLFAQGSRVTEVLICNGEAIAPQNMHQTEPLTSWRRSQAQQKKLGLPTVYMPREHDPKRTVWRGLPSLLPAAQAHSTQGADASAGLSAAVLEWFAHLTEEDVLDDDFPLRLRTVGMAYGAQSSVTEDVVDDALSMRAVLLRHDAVDLVGAALDAVGAADGCALALGGLALNLAQASGKAPPSPSGLPDPADYSDRDRAIERAYAQLDVAFRVWLRELGPTDDPTDAKIRWHRIAHRETRRLGEELLRAVPAVAFTGRPVRGRLLTAAHASAWFARNLRVAVPLAFESSTDTAEPARSQA
ncbi:type I-E CRISPR-associated protein Cse1/CasA [Amycolatopsis antarctica]|uniref:Type I-E CRISPR-associated protein Cse1/CasA n=1 Tax=Amycolatopsis antarctica TaxID=1854586 RepID=A0A263CYL9_9PSEU|nr:type I-E CRISPR-associated protein Cse1/CasA [Amycolatopsis antarctica]OZM71260.1 type I-E CRISPR-associated protein Cse1/CasA [Amycolatopsis antarctica]